MQIGPKEMASAVREMLASAGLPVDLERTGLLERALRLQNQLDSTASDLAATKKVISWWLFVPNRCFC